MNYQEALDFIHGIKSATPKPGLRRIKRLLSLMGNPQDSLRFVHVAGTNGKGSTCTMISHVLQEAGYTVGLNISPFVLDFRERIQRNNELIPEHDLAEATTHVKKYWDIADSEGDTPSEFEVIVAIAFEYFLRTKCDIVVLEVGIGGRFDATNVIKTPLASVITSISIDHTGLLGKEIEQIAGEKAGIIKEGGVTVCYPKQNPLALPVIEERCRRMNNQLLVAALPTTLEIGLEGSLVELDGVRYEIPLLGEHQICNAMTAITACQALAEQGLLVSTENIVTGIKKTTFPGRIEMIASEPLVLMDGAHNLSGAQVLGDALHMVSGRRIHCILGIMQDKDVDGFAGVISQLCSSVVTTSLPELPRFISPEALAKKASAYCDKVTPEQNPQKALELAISQLTSPEDILLICGSLYLASYYRPLLLAHFGNDTVKQTK